MRGQALAGVSDMRKRRLNQRSCGLTLAASRAALVLLSTPVLAGGAEADIAGFPSDPHWLVLLLAALIAALIAIGFLLPARAWQENHVLRSISRLFGSRPGSSPPERTDSRPGNGASGTW